MPYWANLHQYRNSKKSRKTGFERTAFSFRIRLVPTDPPPLESSSSIRRRMNTPNLSPGSLLDFSSIIWPSNLKDFRELLVCRTLVSDPEPPVQQQLNGGYKISKKMSKERKKRELVRSLWSMASNRPGRCAASMLSTSVVVNSPSLICLLKAEAINHPSNRTRRMRRWNSACHRCLEVGSRDENETRTETKQGSDELSKKFVGNIRLARDICTLFPLHFIGALVFALSIEVRR